MGLVGRAGSGKSTVARALAASGAVLIEADAIGHEVTGRDPEVRSALIAEYGPGVYGPDGALDRPQVAARVFSDAAARARLDRLVHPRIIERIRGRIARLVERGWRGTVVVDAALLLDWRLERECDAVLAVVAPEREQLRRLTAARGWNEAEARRRLGVQRSNEDFAAAADETLDNRGTIEALELAALGAADRLRGNRRAR
ncbi:MAG: dephospho-CoA kinase [Candidatus Eisenbacteria bacterium RBG_16_71_46]|nr:MAG: dephospho-CoA kinase [Candidatus Eisenbacteria bacterium RBG_16_71_46]